MRRTRSTLLAVAFATAMLAPLLTASPASAIPAPGDGCNLTVTPGAEIGQYPAQPSSQSGVVVSCVFNNQPGTSQVAAAFTFTDFANANYHNGAARTVTATAAIALGASTFTVTNCQGITGWVNHTITRSPFITGGLAAGTFVKSISGACLVTLSTPTTGAMLINQQFRIDNHNARRMANTALAGNNIDFAAGVNTITSTLLNFTAADIGLSVTGTEFAAETEITAVVAPNATINNATLAADSGTAAPFTTTTLGGSAFSTTTRQCGGATRTATVITSSACKFKAQDIGLPVYDDSGAGISANTYITSVGATSATVNGPAMTVVVAPGFSLNVGDPTVTAPNGVSTEDQVGQQGIQLDLNPGLVAGSQACSSDEPEGFGVVATWNNPGDFAGSALFNTPPSGVKVIGQIYFDTSAADFSGFIVETSVPASLDNTYSLVTPNAPTTSAMCASTATSPGLGYSLRLQAQTHGVAILPAGTGRPGTAQVRNLEEAAGGYQTGYFASATLTSNTAGIVYSPAANFTRLCSYPAGPATVSFRCGNG